MKKAIRTFAVAALILAVAAAAVRPTAAKAEDEVNLQLTANSSCLMEAETGTVIFAKDEKKHYPIASMVKIMTLGIIFDEVEKGTLSPEDIITVSETAAGMGGSQAFLDAHKDYKADDLIMSIIIASANDSCVALAEHIEGSIEGFVNRMNAKVKSLGLEDTLFSNCTGLPTEAAQYSCAYDVSVMTKELIRHPDYFKYAGIWMKDMPHEGGRVTGLTNTNRLVRFYEGCDGGKTGYTVAAKHCLSATAKRNGMRLISTVVGAPDSKTRFNEVSKQFNYGFANYAVKSIIVKGTVLEGDVAVSRGKAASVKGVVSGDYFVFGKKSEAAKEYTTENVYAELRAPIKAGDTIGAVRIMKDGAAVAEVAIVAENAVAKKGYGDYIGGLFGEWINR